eukprot:1141700-Pelagomonas_calceolata.AAC.9
MTPICAYAQPLWCTLPPQYVVKLADKNDYLLASKVLASGVEFGVLKQVGGSRIIMPAHVISACPHVQMLRVSQHPCRV